MSAPWHYLQNGTAQGPIPEEQLRALISSGVLLPSDQVWKEGMGGWVPIQSLPDMAALAPPSNLPPQPAQGQPAVPPKKTNQMLLWVLGGCGTLLLLVFIGAVAFTLWMKKKVGDLQRNPAVATAELLVRANPELEVVSTDYAKGTITLRSKKSGETLTMDANEVKQGRFTFKDGKGGEVRFQAPEGGTGPVRIFREGPQGWRLRGPHDTQPRRGHRDWRAEGRETPRHSDHRHEPGPDRRDHHLPRAELSKLVPSHSASGVAPPRV